MPRVQPLEVIEVQQHDADETTGSVRLCHGAAQAVEELGAAACSAVRGSSAPAALTGRIFARNWPPGEPHAVLLQLPRLVVVTDLEHGAARALWIEPSTFSATKSRRPSWLSHDLQAASPFSAFIASFCSTDGSSLRRQMRCAPGDTQPRLITNESNIASRRDGWRRRSFTVCMDSLYPAAVKLEGCNGMPVRTFAQFRECRHERDVSLPQHLPRCAPSARLLPAFDSFGTNPILLNVPGNGRRSRLLARGAANMAQISGTLRSPTRDRNQFSCQTPSRCRARDSPAAAGDPPAAWSMTHEATRFGSEPAPPIRRRSRTPRRSPLLTIQRPGEYGRSNLNGGRRPSARIATWKPNFYIGEMNPADRARPTTSSPTTT